MVGRRGIEAGRAFVVVAIRNFVQQGLRKIRQQLKSFQSFSADIGTKLFAGGTALAAPFIFATAKAAEFEDQIAAVGAISQATTAELQGIAQVAKNLGRTTSFTASEVAASFVELSRAGFSPAEQKRAQEPLLALARVTQTELPLAAQTFAAALRSFGLDSEESARVINVLGTATNSSAQRLEDLFESLKLVAPIAVDAGIEIEEVAATLALLANNGLKGSLAGTAVTRAIRELANASKSAKLENLTGVSSGDQFGNLRSLPKVLKEVSEATSNLGNKERISIFEEIFGKGQQAATILGRTGAQFNDLQDKISNPLVSVTEAAEKMEDTTGGAIRRVQSAFEGLQLSLANSSGDIKTLIDRFANFVVVIGGVIERNKQLVANILVVVAAIVGAGGLGIAISFLVGLMTGPAGIAIAVGGVIAAMLKLTGTFSTLANTWNRNSQQMKADTATAFGGIAEAVKNNRLKAAFEILVLELKIQFERMRSAAAKGVANFFNEMKKLQSFGLFDDFYDEQFKIDASREDVLSGRQVEAFRQQQRIIMNGEKRIGDQKKRTNDFAAQAQSILKDTQRREKAFRQQQTDESEKRLSGIVFGGAKGIANAFKSQQAQIVAPLAALAASGAASAKDFARKTLEEKPELRQLNRFSLGAFDVRSQGIGKTASDPIVDEQKKTTNAIHEVRDAIKNAAPMVFGR